MYRKLSPNEVIGWALSLLALVVYVFTAQRTVGFWDSGEFIATSHNLQVTHPPGAPLYTLLTRFFTLFFPKSAVAFGVSIFSALCGALTIKVLYHTIYELGRRVTAKLDVELSEKALQGSGIVGALTLLFSHTFWVSSTEAEVYTLSLLFSVVTYRIFLYWMKVQEDKQAGRWLIMTFLMLGLSTGVHIMNLAVLFPISMLYVLDKKGISIKAVGIAFGLGLGLFIVFNNLLLQGATGLAKKLELFLVTSMSMPKHSGLFVTFLLLFGSLAFGIRRFQKKQQQNYLLLAVGVGMYLIGILPFGMSVARSGPHFPISTSANDALRLQGYILSDQYSYADRPVLSGRFYGSPLDQSQQFSNGPSIWNWEPELEQYVQTNDGKYTVQNYAPEFNTLFSRMYDEKSYNVNNYKRWVDFKGEKVRYKIGGKTKEIVKPTFSDNFRYFMNFQLGWLNLRYLMWNFAGKQNNDHGVGGVEEGNWMSGIGFLDRGRIGDTRQMPDFYQNHPGRDNYFMIPFLLGLVGVAFLAMKSRQEFFSVVLFFLAFGAAISIFINQLPIHVSIRERDYVFLGAYYAFAIFIGLSVLGVHYWLVKSGKQKVSPMVLTIVCVAIAPLSMAVQGWNDHDRSHDHFARVLAKSYLDSCEEGAILITQGDNATFPIWYLQEVEDYRTDVRVVNTDLLTLDWYIDRLKNDFRKSKRLKISVPGSVYRKGTDQLLPFYQKSKNTNYKNVKKVVADVVSERERTVWNGRNINFMSAQKFYLEVDSNELANKGWDPAKYGAKWVDVLRWNYAKNFYNHADLMLLDILAQNNWERPIYFTQTGNYGHRIGLNAYLMNRGTVSQLMPFLPDESKGMKRLDDYAFNQQFVSENLFSRDFKEDYQPIENRDIAFGVFMPAVYFQAKAAIARGEKESAKQLVDRYFETYPNEIIPYNKNMFDMAKVYYEVGDTASGSAVVAQILNNIQKRIEWNLSFRPKHFQFAHSIVANHLQVAGIILNQHKDQDPEQAGKLEKTFMELERRFKNWEK